MAKNLRSKIPANDTLIIHDRNKHAATRFVGEVGITVDRPNPGQAMGFMGIEIASSPRQVAENSVHCLPMTSANVFFK